MYPKFKDKHQYSSLITPEKHLEHYKKVGKYPTKLPPFTVIFCYHSTFLKKVLEMYAHIQCDGCFHKLYFFADHPSVAIADFGIGAPSVAAKLELLSAWGVKNFISIGLAGSLQTHLKIGDIVVCEKAIRDEGTSHHYHHYEEFAYPSDKITKSIIGSLEEMQIPFKYGASWTIDTFYRQTKEEVKLLQKEGVLTVEMEAAALFTIAKYCKVELGAAFTISDSLAELIWDPHFYRDPIWNGLEILLEAAIKSATKICRI